GRKINNAEHQLAFIEMLRLITDQRISPEEAVRAYHGVLQGKNIKPKLPLEKDLELTDQAMSYDGSSSARATVAIRNNPVASTAPNSRSTALTRAQWPRLSNGAPNFELMNPEQRRAYDLDRLARKFGSTFR